MKESLWTSAKLTVKAAEIRRLAFESVMRAKKGHLGGSFSVVEILVALFYGQVMRFDPQYPDWENRDRFILSKAHSSNRLHAVLADRGFFPRSHLDTM